MSEISDVEFGLQVMNFGDPEYVYTDVLEELIRAAEEAGFDILTVGDHIAFPDDIPPEYPYNKSGQVRHRSDMNVYEPFQLLSYFAGVSEDIRLGTNTCVVPLRHPVFLAKNALILDSLSGGRFDFGVGVGWSQNEFDILDVPFTERGSRTDEFLDLFQHVCSEGIVEYQGEHYTIRPTGFFPRPVQNGGPPIWVGGHSSAAIRRLAEFGRGYLSPPGSTPEEVGELRKRIMNAWTDYDREGAPSIAVLEYANVDQNSTEEADPLVGSPDSIIEGIQNYIDNGVTRILFKLYRSEPPEFEVTPVKQQIEQINRISEHIMPSFD